MAFGKKLEAALKLKGIRPGTLARMTGINKNTIYSIIQRDTEKVNVAMIQQIANALDMSIDSFIGSDTDDLLGVQEDEPASIDRLSDDEQEFLENFAALNEQNRHILLVISAALLRDQARAADSQAKESGK